MPVELVRPGKRHAEEFTRAARRSRKLHAGVVTPARDEEAFGAYLRATRAPNRESYLICCAETRAIAGVASLNEIVRGAFHSAYLGYYAFVPHAGRGLMFEGVSRVLDRAFGEHGLHRVEANIQPENEPSLRLARRLGFRLEGFSPAYLKVSGRWRDHERFALLAAEWKRARRRSRA